MESGKRPDITTAAKSEIPSANSNSEHHGVQKVRLFKRFWNTISRNPTIEPADKPQGYTFEEQSNNIRELDSPFNTKIRYLDIIPHDEEGTPTQIGNTIAFSPGHTATFIAYQGLLHNWHDMGKHTISYESPRGRTFALLPESLNFSQYGLNETYREVMYFLNLLDTQPEGQKIDLVGHSKGASIVLLAALVKGGRLWDRLGKIVLINPVGFDETIPQNGRERLSKTRQQIRGLSESMKQVKEAGPVANTAKDEGGLAVMLSGAKYIKDNPGRAVQELWDLQDVDSYTMAQELKALGADITIIQATDDKVINSETVARRGQELGIKVVPYQNGHLGDYSKLVAQELAVPQG